MHGRMQETCRPGSGSMKPESCTARVTMPQPGPSVACSWARGRRHPRLAVPSTGSPAQGATKELGGGGVAVPLERSTMH